jgi:hypothetical protein
MIQCTAHMFRSFAFLSQSCQRCFFVYSSVLLYLFNASLCFTCILCCRFCLCLYDSLPSLSAYMWRWVSSLVHQRFNFGEIIKTSTELFMASWIALVMLLHCMFRCLWLQMGVRGWRFASCLLSAFLKPSQLTSWKLCTSFSSLILRLSSSFVTIGK